MLALVTGDPIDAAERAQGLFQRDSNSAAVGVLLVACAGLFLVLMNAISRHGKVVRELHDEAMARADAHRKELERIRKDSDDAVERVRKEHLQTLLSVSDTARILADLSSEWQRRLGGLPTGPKGAHPGPKGGTTR